MRSTCVPAIVVLSLTACPGSDPASDSGAATEGIPGADDGDGDGADDGDGGSGADGGGSADDGGSDSGPDPIDSPHPPGSCGLDEPAFCETFETAHPGGRGGDIDETLWSFSRWAHLVQFMWVRVPAKTYDDRLYPATFCGEEFSGIMPPDDVRACQGVGADGSTSNQLHEVFDDQGDFAFNSMRVRQPFDFTDRTGTIVWDVDAKINPHNGGHGWWIEVWITEDPQPMPYHEAPMVVSLPRKGLGLAFRFGGGCPSTDDAWGNMLESIVITEDYQIRNWFDDIGWQTPDTRCFRSMDGHLNHFELRISQDHVELWASDFDDPDSFQLRATETDLDLPFSRGYVHFQHAHYNAAKDGLEGCEEGVPDTCPTPTQTFRWDNIGFDGPTYPTPRGYDVADSYDPGPEDGPDTGIYTGWYFEGSAPRSFTVSDVDLTGAIGASFNLDVIMAELQTFEYRFNGGAWHAFTLPTSFEGRVGGPGFRGYSLPVDLAELVDGDNTIDVRVPTPHEEPIEGLGNLDLTIEVGS
jgi:hypothetical protein